MVKTTALSSRFRPTSAVGSIARNRLRVGLQRLISFQRHSLHVNSSTVAHMQCTMTVTVGRKRSSLTSRSRRQSKKRERTMTAPKKRKSFMWPPISTSLTNLTPKIQALTLASVRMGTDSRDKSVKMRVSPNYQKKTSK